MSERSIFLAVLEKKNAEERAAFLDEACAGDADLRRQIECLLEEHARAGSFLEKAAIEEGPATNPPTTVPAPAMEGPGSRVGPYKLLQRIGEGGFGMVYMAEQEQPVRRRVALKIIKPGMDSAQIIARFEAERQALALMDHQNIARVYDAGATPTGRPYFVMELVHGVPITKYCDENHLTLRERLQLFVPICRAIQHAHQKGIIHRDIKPSNILVTLYDGNPAAKVIDFGVAKAIEQRLTERTMFTQYGSVVGTFEYMAPEQAEMSALGVDTRSDIYSLGVLLYELLTGSTPLERQRVRHAAYTEVVRMIKEDEPPRPSIRLSTSATLAAVAAARKTEPAKLARLIRGELDWIVMKCLEKDRTRRYETANGLVRDLERYLADEPVEACPPSAAYKLMKLARKYKKGVAVATAFIMVLVAGAIVSALLAVRATRAEAEERRERDAAAKALAQSEAVSDFLTKDLLGQAAPEQNERARKVTVEDLLGRAAQRIDNQAKFADQPEVEATLRLIIGNTLYKLGDMRAAEPHVRRALVLRRQALGPEHPDTLMAQEDLAFLLEQGISDAKEILPLAQSTWEARRRVLGPEHPRTLESLDTYCNALTQAERYAQAAELRRQCLEGRRRVLGEKHPETLQSMANLTADLGSQGLYADAEPIMQECLRLNLETLGPRHPETLVPRSNLAMAQWYRGKFVEAEKTIREFVDIAREVTGPKSFQTLHGEHILVRILDGAGKLEQAERLGRDMLAVKRELLPTRSPHIGRTLVVLGLVLVSEGKAADAADLLGEAVNIFRDSSDRGDWILQAQVGRGTALLALGKLNEGERLLNEAGPRLLADRRIPPWQIQRIVESVAKAYERAGKATDAAAWRAKLAFKPKG
jgi:serine/threonine protein kinase